MNRKRTEGFDCDGCRGPGDCWVHCSACGTELLDCDCGEVVCFECDGFDHDECYAIKETE